MGDRPRWLLGPRARARAPWVLLGAAAVVLVAHSLVYNFVTDDAYISFVYSRNFAEHGELAFNLGAPVEGYTNFLWTVLLGALMVVKIPPEISSRVLGTACAIGTLVVVTRMMARALAPVAERAGGEGGEKAAAAAAEETATKPASAGRWPAWSVVPALLLACSSGFACWSSGGLETQLFTLLIAGALDAVTEASVRRRALRRAGALLALASMTRPEGPLLAAILGAAWLAYRVLDARHLRRLRLARATIASVGAGAGFPLREELLAAAWFLGLWLPWFAWRWWYYGWPFPNTYYVKAAGEWADAHTASPQLASRMIDNGLYYVWVWLQQTRLLYALPLALLGLGANLVLRPRTPRGLLALACLLVAAIYVPYAISVGGDFMGLHRFIMPLFVVAAIAIVLGLVELLRFVPAPHRAAASIAAAAALVAAFGVTQARLTRASLASRTADRGIDTPGFLIVYTEDRAKIGRAMAPCFREDDFSIVGGAGAQPYYARMRAIDVFGLVSERIAHEEPRRNARAGHTKWGSDTLLADYDPTFVFSCYDIQPTEQQPQLGWCSGFWRARGYELVTMHVPGLEERGTYYTFLAKKARDFQCPGRVH